jgi:hypothetical protein
LNEKGIAFPEERIDRKSFDPGFAAFMEQRCPTLAKVVQICSFKEDQGWRANPRVGAVLTFNIDALVENYDRALHGSPRILRTIERASKRRHSGKIPLYHLHGLLLPEAGGSRKETTDSLVLSEQDYYERTETAHAFATTMILWALREFVCIFVGCSMADELMRRSLYLNVGEQRRARKAEGRTRMDAHHFAVVEHGSADRLLEKDLARLGVRPLWVGNCDDELANRLGNLRQAILPFGACG